MKMVTKCVSKAAMLAMVCASVVSCSSEEDPKPDTALQLTVVNELGNSVSGAAVILYSSEQDWLEFDQSGMMFGETDANGVVTFPGLESKKYFFDVTKGTDVLLTNYDGSVTIEGTLDAGKTNEVNVVVKESIKGYLADEGKKWKVNQAFINDQDYTAEYKSSCESDNIQLFQKDGIVVFEEGAVVCEGSASRYEGNFTVNGSVFTTVDQIDGTESWSVYEIDHNSAIIFTEDADGNVYTLEIVAQF